MILFIGLSWTSSVAFGTFMLIASLFFDDGTTFKDILPLLLFLIPFWVIGISMIVAGVKNIKRIKEMYNDYNNNPTLYGKIFDMKLVGNYERKNIYNIDIAVYNPISKEIHHINIQCPDFKKFYTGVFVELKEIEDRYIITNKLDEDTIPEDAKVELQGIQLKDENGYSVRLKDTVIVNGVEYVRKK